MRTLLYATTALAVGLFVTAAGNAGSLPIKIKIQVLRPDLKITQMLPNGKHVAVRVTNLGKAPSGACWLRVTAYKSFFGVTRYGVVPALAPGQSKTIYVGVFPFSMDWTKVRATVDFTNLVMESNEANNVVEVILGGP